MSAAESMLSSAALLSVGFTEDTTPEVLLHAHKSFTTGSLIVVLTADGTSANLVAKYRPPSLVVVASTDETVLRQSAVAFGQVPLKVCDGRTFTFVINIHQPSGNDPLCTCPRLVFRNLRLKETKSPAFDHEVCAFLGLFASQNHHCAACLGRFDDSVISGFIPAYQRKYASKGTDPHTHPNTPDSLLSYDIVLAEIKRCTWTPVSERCMFASPQL